MAIQIHSEFVCQKVSECDKPNQDVGTDWKSIPQAPGFSRIAVTAQVTVCCEMKRSVEELQ